MREMKDSGIEWIGTIPFDWKCCKQKYEIQLINGRAYSDSEFEEDGKYRILRVGNLFSNPTWYTSSLELPPDKYCENGDLLYSWSMSYAPVIWTGEKVIYHYHIWKTKLSSNLNKKFAYYYLSALTDELKAKIHETTMGFITMGVMNNSYIAFPCLKEQEIIVSFLDSKCSEIDAISADIQKEIEILEQYKRSVITEAVTKGLNPDVEMKDSSVEWVGIIPASWTSSRLGYETYIRARLGWKGLKADEYVDEGYAFISAFNIQNNKLVWTPLNYITKERYDESPEIKLHIGDVIIVKDGAGIGKCARIDSLPMGETAPNSSIGVITPLAKLNYRYLAYYLQSAIFNNLILKLLNGMGVPHLTQEVLNKTPILLPPKQEQVRIANFLDSKCCEIDSAIETKKKQIDILDTYKKSLIYEYVTGKKEVPVQN